MPGFPRRRRWRRLCSTGVAGAHPAAGRRDTTMQELIGGRWYRALVSAALQAVLVAAIMVPGSLSLADEPKPDPAGIATGDRSAVYDAGGTAFAVAEPTDNTATEYAEKKKAFDEY